MLRNPRVWLHVAGFWLIVCGLAHGYVHVTSILLEGRQDFAARAMQSATSLEPLHPSLWTRYGAYSVGLALLLIGGGIVDVLLAWMEAPPRILRAIALAGTLFWTVAFAPFAFLHPVLLPIVASALAVPLHGIVWLTAVRSG